MANERLNQVLNLLKQEPNDAFLNHALAMEHLSEGNLSAAIVAMERVIANNPEHTGTYYHLGYAYLNLGDKVKALAIWEEGIALCKQLKKQHHLAELQSAYNELIFEDED